ncbi:MAG: hypothetical protein IIC57_04900 [Proteobacteria bacterium]|nr:hypothetical protein [Pseudomonadota bacterium]
MNNAVPSGRMRVDLLCGENLDLFLVALAGGGEARFAALMRQIQEQRN